MKGINEGMGGRGGGPTDIFDLLNGRSGRSGGRDQVRRGPDVQFPLKVTLEDLYNGKTSKIAIQRDRNCTECGGAGGKDVR